MTCPGAHGEGEIVTLWRTHEMVVPSDEAIGRPEWHEERVADETYAYPDSEYRALPVAAYNALLARANTATVAADLMRARAERAEEALRELLVDAEGSYGSEAWSSIAKARAALSTQRGEGGS